MAVEYNIEKTGKQCRIKVKKLCQEYKKIKDKQNLTDRGRTEWKYFSKLDDILAAHPATHPAVLLETLDSQPIPSDHGSDKTDVEGSRTNVQDHSSVADHVSNNQSCSGSSIVTVSMSGTPPSRHGSSSSAKEDSDEIPTTDNVGKKRSEAKRKY